MQEEEQTRREQEAIEQTRRRAEEEAKQAAVHAARLAEENRLELLARERAEAERAEQTALTARIEAERKLAEQLEARIEQEQRESEQAAQRAEEEKKLAQAAAEREARERKLQEEEQTRREQEAIEQSRRRAEEEAKQAAAHAARLAEQLEAEEASKPADIHPWQAPQHGTPFGADTAARRNQAGKKTAYAVASVLFAAVGLYFVLGNSPVEEPTEIMPPPLQTLAESDLVLEPAEKPVDGSAPLAVVRVPDKVEKEPSQLALKMSSQLLGQDRPGRAEKAADSTAHKAADWDARYGMLRERLRAGAYAEVSGGAQELTDDYPQRWEAWFLLGSAQLGGGQMELAEASLERAGKLNSAETSIWVQRAVVA
ncbi:MAG: hypothetical protein Q8M66_07445, partial [Actinomycetota bacterium]|nr:hypothetical protein [Actinomycetota bacterium]